MALRLAAFLLCLGAAPVMAGEPVALHCARAPGEYPDAELRLNDQGAHVVHVTFVGYRPSRSRADWSLRDCLSTATKLVGKRDLDARLWYRERGGESQPLEPAALTQKAVSRRVVNP